MVGVVVPIEKPLAKMLTEVEEFLFRGTPEEYDFISRKAWFQCNELDLYLRIEPKPLFNRAGYFYGGSVLCISNVTVVRHKSSSGVYSNFLKWLEENSPYHYIVIENVSDKRQQPMYSRRGYATDHNPVFETLNPDSKTFYKELR